MIICLGFVVQSFSCVAIAFFLLWDLYTHTLKFLISSIFMCNREYLPTWVKTACFCSGYAPFFQRRVAAVQSREVQQLLPQQQTLPCAQSGQARLVTRRSVATGRIMRGLSHSSLRERRCSLSYPSHTHPHMGNAKVTRRGWPWEMMFRAKVDGGMRPSPRMTLLAVKVMRYVCSCGKTLAC